MIHLDWHKIVRRGGGVRRFHTDFMFNPQNNATHSYNCALMVYSLAKECDERNQLFDPTKCMKYMLVHDLAEQHAGDMPGHAKTKKLKEEMDMVESEWEKRFLPEEFACELNSHERVLCHFVDKIECLITTAYECRIGNMEMLWSFQRQMYSIQDITMQDGLYSGTRDVMCELLGDVQEEFEDVWDEVYKREPKSNGKQ